MGSVHVKTSVSLMLGSVVNTLEQRGEWLNGGRGAATAMIDRRSANRRPPFGAAEHLEFLEPAMIRGSARMASCGERWEEAPLQERRRLGVAFEDMIPLMEVCRKQACVRREKRWRSPLEPVRARIYTHRPRQQASCPGVEPLHPRWLTQKNARTHICSGHSGGGGGEGGVSPQIHLVFDSNMAPTPIRHIFFYLSVAFP